MQNFFRLASNIDVMPLYGAIARNPHLWNQHTLRTEHPETAHGQVDDIWLRFNALPDDQAAVVDDRESINYPAFAALPEARPLIFSLMSAVQGERLGRCIIASLPPGGRVLPHVDGGAPAEYYDRYHIVLQALPGVVFRSGDEPVQMRTGEIWWFDNTKEHEVINNSSDDRLHLIVDIRTYKP